MNAMKRIDHALMVAIEQALSAALSKAQGPGCPPRLTAAIQYAVFPGGQRIRPRVCLAVACACGDGDPAIADAAAAAIELLHCASLIHDDLPSFDDACTRRGKPSVHRAFGEQIAVLTGDALIVLAFETLARGAANSPQCLAPLLLTISRSVGVPSGIVTGQAWECEPHVALADYQRAKTGVLFAAATEAGALAARYPEPHLWRTLGEKLGEAYQVADDIGDFVGNPGDLGKPVGRDEVLGRPSATRELGLDGAIARLEHLVTEAVDSIPDCANASGLRAVIRVEAERFLPKELRRAA